MQEELSKYQLENSEVTLIRDKDGIAIYRINDNGKRYIMKHFVKACHRREIFYYQWFKENGMLTIPLHAHTEASLLMEDIATSLTYRFGEEKDLDNKEVVIALANYYRQLHSLDVSAVPERYHHSEVDLLTSENIHRVSLLFASEQKPFFDLLRNEVVRFKAYYQEHRVVTYNDYFPGNMIVRVDQADAFLFDYNLVGKGIRGFDFMNVSHWMDDGMKKRFLEAYGGISDYELLAAEVFQPLVSLIMVMDNDSLPKWAKEIVEDIESGKMFEKLARLSST